MTNSAASAEAAPMHMAVSAFMLEQTVETGEPTIGEPAVALETADRGVAFQEAPLPKAYLWQAVLDTSYNARQCVIDFEARFYGVEGMYTAENGGTPGDEPGVYGTASGAYQNVDLGWRTILPRAEAFLGLSLVSKDEEAHGARLHAAYAEPFVQDLVSGFAMERPELIMNIRPWTHPTCYAIIGTDKQVRPDGPENGPTPYVQAQLDQGYGI